MHVIIRTNSRHLCNSVVEQYFKANSDVIAVNMATGQLHKKFRFCKLFQKLSW